MNPVLAVIWWLMLAVAVLVVTPLLVVLLQRALNAARQIERYTAEILDSGGAIAANIENVAALKETISTAGGLLAALGSIERYSADIEVALAAKEGNGTLSREEV